MVFFFSLKVHFDGLFGGKQKELQDTTNSFFNENWREIEKEIHPAITESVGKIYENLFNKLFGAIPYEEMFLS